MSPGPDQLAALAAIVDGGTFDAAARALHVTPSAVSQRARALEAIAGRVVVTRTTPCRVTEAGEPLLRLARQTGLLYDEAARSWDPGGVVGLSVAVNADSLDTWFRDVLTAAASWDGVAVRLHVEDQAWSADLLRRGEVLGAVTSDAAAVQGCSSEPLGSLRYRPAASPAFAERWGRGSGLDWANAPVVVFNEKDDLQAQVLRRRGHAMPPVVHRVPTSADFHAAVRAGLGWGLLPDPQLEPDLASGALVTLHARERLDVALHWQRWRLGSPALDRLTAAVRDAARAALRRPAGGAGFPGQPGKPALRGRNFA